MAFFGTFLPFFAIFRLATFLPFLPFLPLFFEKLFRNLQKFLRRFIKVAKSGNKLAVILRVIFAYFSSFLQKERAYVILTIPFLGHLLALFFDSSFILVSSLRLLHRIFILEFKNMNNVSFAWMISPIHVILFFLPYSRQMPLLRRGRVFVGALIPYNNQSNHTHQQLRPIYFLP